MGIFGKKRVPGISTYELEHEHVRARLDSVFPSNRPSSKLKRTALHTALGIATDRDTNMGHRQKEGVIQREEFDTVVENLTKGGVITSDEATQLRKIAQKPLSD